MPFTLALTHYTPMLAVHAASRRPRADLQAVATAAVVGLQTLWLGVFRDIRRALTLTALTQSLQASHILDTRALLDRIWWQHGEVPVRSLLPVLAVGEVEDAAAVLEPSVTAAVGQEVTFRSGLAETDHAIGAYVGTQVRLIGATTMQTVRGVLWTGWQASQAPAILARAIRAAFGLTPSQQRGIAALRERDWAVEHPTEAAHMAQVATEQALQRRAQTIAQTQSWTLTQMGQQMLWHQAVRGGAVQEDAMRRYWRVSGNERTCTRCLAIPPLNPDGVGIDQPFHSDEGPIMGPTLHPLCRCEVDYQVVA
jgi:hypothetical protein